jgi:tetratricopeptide (TPR) repeat protein
LRNLFEQAKAGEGRVVVIEGEAGIGKSRLVDELIARLQRDGEDLDFLFGSYPPNGAATVSGAFSRAYREQFGEAGSQGYLPQSPILVPAFDALLRGESAPPDVEPLTKDSLQTCFVQATRTLAAKRPTIVLIDDLHFAPEEGRSLFTSLAMAVPGHRVLLIGTTRPGANADWQTALDRFDHASRITPPRLGGRDLVKLLEDAFQSKALAESLGVKIIVKSDGNPFFAFEIIQGLREGQFIKRMDNGTWISTRVIEEIEIPSSVLDLVNARVTDLTEEERDLLDVAACWGYEFDPGLIGDVLGLERIPLLKLFGHIERAHRLVRSSGRDYVFDHHQVQEALYETMHVQMREAYHASLADALETRTRAAEADPGTLDGALCVELCEHFLAGAKGERALRYLEAAQTHLTTGYLNAQAADLAERALAAPELLTGLERAKTLVRLGAALAPLGRHIRQEEAAREAERLAEQAGDGTLRGKAANLLGTCLHHTSRHEEAETALRRALEIALGEGDPEAESAVTVNLGRILESLGRLAEAREHYERALAKSREIGYLQGEAAATGNLGNICQSLGRPEEAREHHERRLALSRELGDRQGEATATGNLGNVFKSQGRLAEAQQHYERHLTLSREIGFRPGEVNALGNLGNVFLSLGRTGEAREYQERLVAICREMGHRESEAITVHNLGLVLREQGEEGPAEEQFLACLALSEEIGYRYVEAATHLALGGLRVEAGDSDAGRKLLVSARDLAAEVGAAGIETLAHCHIACLPGGDAKGAITVLHAQEDRLEADERREARCLLWRATGDRAHIEEAKRLLDMEVASVDEEARASMLTNLRLNREIVAAWTEHRGSS